MAMGSSAQRPVYIPDPLKKQDTCPNCNKPEDVVTVCKHCGYKYPEDCNDPTWGQILSWIINGIIIGWIAVTLFYWLFCQIDEQTCMDRNQYSPCKKTLRMILEDQADLFKNARF